MHLSEVKFKRKFSLSPYKNMKIKMAEMSFKKDFVNDDRGDLYPVILKSDGCREAVADNFYTVTGELKRMICQYFPYASYRIKCKIREGEAGFFFKLPAVEVTLTLTEDHAVLRVTDTERSIELPSFARATHDLTVSCRPGAIDLYLLHNGGKAYFHTFKCEELKCSDLYSEFSYGFSALYINGDVTVTEVESFLDNGISIADMRPVRYENGDVMTENGKVYLTVSIRLAEGCYQGVFSWVPGTMVLEMTGAIFYDAGDGRWCSDVAASILYHREKKKWLLWVCSFSHGHVLAHAELSGDPRFGVNVVDVEVMKETEDKNDPTRFEGFPGDEDPDFFYSEKHNKWYMSICRLQPGVRKYRYVFFESDHPFSGYKFIGMGNEGEETGGSFVRVGEDRYFVCGNSFKARSDYRIYDSSGMYQPTFDFPDGGFRGWGTVIPVEMGTRTRLFWLTFDRHKGSDYNWSYGNLYCFEGDM